MNWRFEGTYRLHHKGGKNQCETCFSCHLLLISFLPRRLFLPWWWTRYVPPNRGVLQQPQASHPIVGAVKTSKLTRTNNVKFYRPPLWYIPISRGNFQITPLNSGRVKLWVQSAPSHSDLGTGYHQCNKNTAKASSQLDSRLLLWTVILRPGSYIALVLTIPPQPLYALHDIISAYYSTNSSYTHGTVENCSFNEGTWRETDLKGTTKWGILYWLCICFKFIKSVRYYLMDFSVVTSSNMCGSIYIHVYSKY
jgi:hypothetical protein